MGRFAPDNFAASRQRDFAVLVATACGVAACCLAVLVALLRGRRRCGGSPWAALAPGGPCGRRAREGGAVEASLREELDRRRLERALRMIPWAMALVFVNLLVLTVRSALDGGSVKRFGSTIQDIAISLMSSIISMMWASQWARVSIVTLRSLDYWFSALMLCLVAYMSPYAIRADLVAYRMNMSCGSALLCCLFNLRPLVNIPWLLLLGIMSSYTLMFGENAEKIQDDAYSSQDVLSDGIQNVILMVVILLVFNHLMTCIVRLEYDAKGSRRELSATYSVLRSVCEVVVDLDEEFRLQRHSGELADMLFLNPQRSLKKEDFRSFLASESDRIKFAEQMGRLALPCCREDCTDLSKTFQVFIKDSQGISVNVHAVVVPYFSCDGLPAFMMGVLEVSDSMPLPSRRGRTEDEIQPQRQRVRQSKQRPQGEPPRPPLGPQEEAGGHSGCSGSSSDGDGGADDITSRSTSLGPEVVEGDAPDVWLDALSGGCVMLHFTDSFQHWFGPCQEGEPFLPWIKINHREQFAAWIQESWQALQNGEASIEIFPRALHFLR
ncbi:unnamed protein product [Prorocentrum cordatum]|nr:unnamed protein product [Polarella glacialis]